MRDKAIPQVSGGGVNLACFLFLMMSSIFMMISSIFFSCPPFLGRLLTGFSGTIFLRIVVISSRILDVLLRILDVLSRIDHNFLDMRPFSTRQKPLERARRQLSNGFCLVEKDLILRKLGHILGNDIPVKSCERYETVF